MDAPAKPAWPKAPDLTVTAFEGVAVSLFDLYRERLRRGENVISGVTFTNCRIEGPVVLLALSGVIFDAVDFGYAAGDVRNLVLRPASPDKVIGAIPVRDCLFKGVQFFAVGFTGSDDFIQQLLAVQVD